MSESTSTLESGANARQAPKASRMIGMAALFIVLVILMTLTRLPEAKITSYIQGMVQTALDPYGVYLSDHGRELSIWKGMAYRLDHPVLELADQTRIEFDDLTVKPSILGLLSGKLGVEAELHQGPASIGLSANGKSDKINAQINLENVDLGKLGVFAFAAGIKGSGLVNGSVNIEGSLNDFGTLNGDIALKLRKLHTDEQNLMGFALPALNISEGEITIPIQSGKLQLKKVELGKGMDDLRLSLTGTLALNRFLNASQIDLRAVFAFSDKVKQSLSILESLLGSAKTSDGRYAYKLTGQLGSPIPVPDPK
jgi:type II secretion system protein N